jgi:hypothetical protein
VSVSSTALLHGVCGCSNSSKGPPPDLDSVCLDTSRLPCCAQPGSSLAKAAGFGIQSSLLCSPIGCNAWMVICTARLCAFLTFTLACWLTDPALNRTCVCWAVDNEQSCVTIM